MQGVVSIILCYKIQVSKSDPCAIILIEMEMKGVQIGMKEK